MPLTQEGRENTWPGKPRDVEKRIITSWYPRYWLSWLVQAEVRYRHSLVDGNKVEEISLTLQWNYRGTPWFFTGYGQPTGLYKKPYHWSWQRCILYACTYIDSCPWDAYCAITFIPERHPWNPLDHKHSYFSFLKTCIHHLTSIMSYQDSWHRCHSSPLEVNHLRDFSLWIRPLRWDSDVSGDWQSMEIK